MKKSVISKRTILIALAALLICVFLLVIVKGPVQNKSAIDIYVTPELTPFGGMVTRDYMRLQSDKKQYNAGEEIALNASCGFYKPPNGYGAETICFDIACSQYVDVSVSVATLEPFPDIKDFVMNGNTFIPTIEHNIFHGETKVPDPDQLILKEGFFGQINRESLQYHFNVALQVKPDTPESFSGSLYIRVYDRGGGNLYGCGSSYIKINFKKDGNTVTLLQE